MKLRATAPGIVKALFQVSGKLHTPRMKITVHNSPLTDLRLAVGCASLQQLKQLHCRDANRISGAVQGSYLVYPTTVRIQGLLARVATLTQVNVHATIRKKMGFKRRIISGSMERWISANKYSPSNVSTSLPQILEASCSLRRLCAER